MRDATVHQVPTAYELRGALHVARLLPPTGTRRQDLHLAYRGLPRAGAFHILDLEHAEQRLVAWGLAEMNGEWITPTIQLQELATDDDAGACENLAIEALATASPTWLGAAVTGNGVANELLPDLVTTRLTSAFPDPDRREAILLAAARIANDTQRRVIGAAGEELVVAEARAELLRLGRDDLAEQVCRLSERSDQLGYDVRAPRLPGGVWRIEVKSSSRHRLALEFFISRAEAETGRRLREWILTMCHVPLAGGASVVGWCRYDTIHPLLPRDAHDRGTWQTARIRAHPGLFKPGLPPLDA
ncbi:MAG: DUF3883 domain-containing protein [Acidimicrobiia bacterium]